MLCVQQWCVTVAEGRTGREEEEEERGRESEGGEFAEAQAP